MTWRWPATRITAAQRCQADSAGQSRQHPQHQVRPVVLPQEFPLGHPHRLRQGRPRLPQGPDDRDAHQLGRSLGARSQVLGQDHLHRLRRGRDQRCAVKLGYDINTTDEGQLQEAKQALLDIKPHVQAFLPTNVTKPLLNGSAVMTVDYDYDLGPAATTTRMSCGCRPRRACRPTSRDGSRSPARPSCLRSRRS